MHSKSRYQHSLLAITFCAALMVLCVFAISQEAATNEADRKAVDFEQDIVPLFERRCSGCHAGERAKAGFRIDDRDSVLGYVEPGDIENSLLWTDYLKAVSAHADPATSVMPLNGPIPPHELAIFKKWIEDGAQWPEDFRLITAVGIPSIERTTTEPEGLMQRFSAFIGYFHPAIVHFPIGLLIFGGAAAALSFVTGGRAVYVAFYCLVWGTLFTMVTAYTGWSLAAEKGYPAWSTLPTVESVDAASAVFRHRWLGTFTSLLSIVVLGLAIFAIRWPRSRFAIAWRIGLVFIALLVSIVGHQGGELVYGDLIGKAFNRLLGN